MRIYLQRISAAILIAAMIITSLPAFAFAQEGDTLPVLILPVDRANFLPGSYFDVRVEVHTDALPDDFAVTIDGVDASEFLGAEPTAESWTFGPEASPTPSQSWVWRDVMIEEPGYYLVEVTAGGNTTAVEWEVREPEASAGAKNVILFVADGMTVPMLTAARLVSRGNTEGKFNAYLTVDQMEEIGLISTSGIDSIITDSANSASSYNTGHKSAVNALGIYPDTSPDSLDDPRQETFAEMVKRLRGMAVGIVTTADWTDATPAAVFAHTRRRGDQAFIAAQSIDEGVEPDVILGGGAQWMLPQSTAGSRRQDDRDLFTEYEELGYTIVTSASEMTAALSEETPERLLGMFHPSNMNVWLDRNVYTDNLGDFTDQPGLVEMTVAALDVLNLNPNGFYLMVESASVDKQMHPLDMERTLADLIEFDNALAAAIEWAANNAPDTLIVVTADHGHGFEVYGTVDVDAFNAAEDDAGKRAAIGIYQNAKFPTYVDEDGDFFPDSWDVSRTLAGTVNNHPDYTENFQVSPTPRVPAIRNDSGVYVNNPDDDPNGIPMSGNLPVESSTGVHTLQDVPVFASGPGAEYFGGVMDNTEVFFGMAAAIGLSPVSESGAVECEGFIFNGVCYER
jgi:alkaline phosphatase